MTRDDLDQIREGNRNVLSVPVPGTGKRHGRVKPETCNCSSCRAYTRRGRRLRRLAQGLRRKIA